MKRLLALGFPYACALTILGLIVFDQVTGNTASVPHCSAMGGGEPMAGIPASVYYGAVALVLCMSFALIERREAQVLGSAVLPRREVFSGAFARKLLRHPMTRFVGQAIIVAMFLLIIAAGLFGNQLPTKNIAPLLTWTVWWCGLIVLILYAGKAWCYVCPWDAIAGWAEGLRFWGKRRDTLSLGVAWPRVLRSIWPATILFVALTWLELGFGVTNKPRITAYLALGMLAMAFVSAFVFDRRAFCRYGCLVGRISGLYALFSPVEIRARDRDVCRTCETKSCFRGNDAGEPCPTSQFLGTMEQNTYCISCMECVKTCEADNVALNTRPWGADLLAHHKPRSDEAYLALIMLALSGFHGLTMTPSWHVGVDSLKSALGIGDAGAFSLGMTAILVLPIALYGVLVEVSRRSAGTSARAYREHFMRYAYALLPIALFYHLAHNSEHLFVEGPRVVALMSDPFGWSWNLFGTATWELPPLTSMRTLWGIQVALVVIGHVASLQASRRAASALYSDHSAALRSQIPMLVAMILFSTMSLWLLRQPMEMRSSWM